LINRFKSVNVGKRNIECGFFLSNFI